MKRKKTKPEQEEPTTAEEDTTITDEANLWELKSSTAMVLDMFRKRGMLSKDNTVNYTSRANDKPFHREMERVGAKDDGIKLEYRNKKTGKPMSQKEAFNDMCRTFHNIFPSKKKQAKAERRRQAAHHARYTNPTDMAGYRIMEEYKKQTGMHYVDISKKFKK